MYNNDDDRTVCSYLHFQCCLRGDPCTIITTVRGWGPPIESVFIYAIKSNFAIRALVFKSLEGVELNPRNSSYYVE